MVLIDDIPLFLLVPINNAHEIYLLIHLKS